MKVVAVGVEMCQLLNVGLESDVKSVNGAFIVFERYLQRLPESII